MSSASIASPSEWGAFSPKGLRKTWIGLGRSTPLGRGSLRRFWLKQLRKSGDVLDVLLSGTKVRVNLGDNRSEVKSVIQGDAFMHDEREAIRGVAAGEGALNIVDIGANAGLFTAIALHEARGRGHVLVVEPNPVLLPRLETNIAFNKDTSTVSVHTVAIGPEEGAMRLMFKDDDLGGASLAAGDATSGDQEIEVPIRPLLSLVQEAGMTRIDLLKIDVEGFEDQALIPFFDTAPESLLPAKILMEISHAGRWQDDLRAVWTAHGYAISEERGADITLTRQSVASPTTDSFGIE